MEDQTKPSSPSKNKPKLSGSENASETSSICSQKTSAVQSLVLTEQTKLEARRPSGETASDPPASPQKRHFSLEGNQKHYFFHILQHLLQEPLSLKAGEWDEETHEGNTFRLVYQKKNCDVCIWDAKGQVQWQDTVATLNIYLKWGEGVNEPLSLGDLQRVHNELRFLGLQNEKVNACFSLARNEFVKETWNVQNHCTLQIICDEVNRTFVCGRREYAITILYNDTKQTAAYYFPKWINREWIVECRYG